MMFGGRGRGIGRGGGGMPRSRSVGRTATRVSRYGSRRSGGRGRPPLLPSMVSSMLTRKHNNSSSSSSTPFSLSSSSPPPQHKNPLPIWHSDDSDWVSVDPTEDEDEDDAARARFVLGHAPSEKEVQDALCSLQRVFGSASHVQLVRGIYDHKLDKELGLVTIPSLVNQVSADGTETDWAEPPLYPYNSKMLQANGSDRVYYAIHLLQTDPHVQRIVKSLSTDEAVWDAVLNNEVVRELRESISADEEHVFQSGDGTANSDSINTTNVVIWILNTARVKFMEVIEKITNIMTSLFQCAFNKTSVDAEEYDPFNEKLRAAFMLSIMVMLIVVLSRVH